MKKNNTYCLMLFCFLTLTTFSQNSCTDLTMNLTLIDLADSTICSGGFHLEIHGGVSPKTITSLNPIPTFPSTITGDLEVENFWVNFCYGTPIGFTVTDGDGCSLTVLDTFKIQPPQNGNLKIIDNTNGPSTCIPIDTLYGSRVDCSIDYNAIDTGYFIGHTPYSDWTSPWNNPAQWILGTWVIQDTVFNWWQEDLAQIVFPQVPGCYIYVGTIYCPYQKSHGYSGVRIISMDNFSSAELGELTENEKTIVKITDIMGRECELDAGELRIVLYSDGTISKVISQ
jgi:hypothetical protein